MGQPGEDSEINCLYCSGEHVIRDGWQAGKQRYRCRECSKRFIDTGAVHGRRIPARQIGPAVGMFYSGMSYKQIAERLAGMYDMPEPSKSTIHGWVNDYTVAALEEMNNHPAHTGEEWVVGEVRVTVEGKRLWNWDVMDRETRYILASHLTSKRDAAAAAAVMRKAAKASFSPPGIIKTYRVRRYNAAVKSVFSGARHIRSPGIRSKANNDLPEGLQGIQRQRAKNLRARYRRKTWQLYVDGWALTYNLFRKQEALNGKTPGEAAGVGGSFKKWADVARMGVAGKRDYATVRAGDGSGIGRSREPASTGGSGSWGPGLRSQPAKVRKSIARDSMTVYRFWPFGNRSSSGRGYPGARVRNADLPARRRRKSPGNSLSYPMRRVFRRKPRVPGWR